MGNSLLLHNSFLPLKDMETVLPRPEYPRPHLVRHDWHNLNGEWEFAFDDTDQGLLEGWQDGRALPARITVPFAYQTPLSGINEKGIHEIVWYTRSFEVHEDWLAKDILLHFGAVDYRSSVWVNGQEVGHNQGGHVPFSFNISPYLQEGKNRLVVRVEDKQDLHQPRGKQASTGVPAAFDYYCTTGIWQTVWLEPAPQVRIEDIRITPYEKDEVFNVQIYLHAYYGKWELTADVFDKGKKVATSTQTTHGATASLSLVIPKAKRWTPESPHLYDITITLCKDDETLDEIKTYAGLRSIEIIDGQLHINGTPRYLAMILDQGYWPDGGITAPSDAALKFDVEITKKLGFNGSRKHQKIEDPRWLYWCDKLGLFVWGEMANARAWSVKAEELLMAEWERVVRRDYNHPCIITWVPMNESWGVPGLRDNHPGQYAYVERIVSLTRRLDQFRPIVDNDGWEHTDVSDICAIHDYAATGDEMRRGFQEITRGGSLRQHAWDGTPLFSLGSQYHGQPIMLTEVGGFLMVPLDIPPEKRDFAFKCYGSVESYEELLQKYTDLMEGIADIPAVHGFCYTQLTDIEQEVNGLLTYDRQLKIPAEKIAAVHRRLFKDL
jgi:beta-galactosidase/beta-glucuronidase